MKLSILICSLQKRLIKFATLARLLQEQAENKPVEILWLGDNKTMSVEEKRNKLLLISRGEYVCFVDDDDTVEPDYVDCILKAIEQNPDVVCFDISFTQNGGEPIIAKFSKNYTFNLNHEEGNPDNTKVHVRMPNHLCPVKRELALKAGFPGKANFGEDTGYGIRLRGPSVTSQLKSEVQIGKVLYHYEFSTIKSETHKYSPWHREGWPEKEPMVKMDVVIVSDGSRNNLKEMTQRAVDSIAADDVNIVVVEKADVRYKDADTIPQNCPFNYNESLNIGAKFGNAELICFSNNDVQFPEDFVIGVRNIIKATGADVLSVENQHGFIHPEIISGFCFVMTRAAWMKIGKLNTDYKFWCADNVTSEQIKKHNLKEVKSRIKVTHLTSVSLNVLDPEIREDYTRNCVKKFNKDYDKNVLNMGV